MSDDWKGLSDLFSKYWWSVVFRSWLCNVDPLPWSLMCDSSYAVSSRTFVKKIVPTSNSNSSCPPFSLFCVNQANYLSIHVTLWKLYIVRSLDFAIETARHLATRRRPSRHRLECTECWRTACVAFISFFFSWLAKKNWHHPWVLIYCCTTSLAKSQ